MQDAANAPASSVCSGFRAGLYYESRILGRTPAFWLALAALGATIALALFTGAARVHAQRETIVSARADEARRIDGLKKTLAQLQENDAAGKVAPDLPPYRDPRNAAFMGGGPAARVAVLEPAPLALVAVGKSDVEPAIVRPTTGAKDSFLFVDDIDNPANLASGTTDLAFVLVFVYPLVILALAFNLLAGEREKGVLAMTLASARRPAATLFGKFVVRAGAPIFVALLVATSGVALFAGWPALLTRDFWMLGGVILLYGLFWAALAAVVDGWRKSSAFNALTLIGAWVIVTMIAPAAINSFAAWLHPAPARTDMVLAARAASTDADRARDASLARYIDEHGGVSGATRQRLAAQEAAFARVEMVVAEHDAQLARQRTLVDRLAFLSPALLAYRALADVAGAGDARYERFLVSIRAFHVQWREFFLSRARAGEALTPEDYDAAPHFQTDAVPASDEAAAGSALDALLIGVGLPTLLLALLARRGFKACAP
jgi:ABC-2 type transport system permease protein